MVEVIQGSIYDYPAYYDLVFGSDWKAEFDFFQACFRKHAARSVRRLFEPACGTGRLLIRFAKAGYDVCGLDLNPKAVDYCNRRFVRNGFEPPVFVGDMTDFRLPRRVDAAFNPINSFRELQTEGQAERHLQCMARCLAKGGLYLLGMHLTPTAGPRCEEESWSARRQPRRDFAYAIHSARPTAPARIHRRQVRCLHVDSSFPHPAPDDLSDIHSAANEATFGTGPRAGTCGNLRLRL